MILIKEINKGPKFNNKAKKNKKNKLLTILDIKNNINKLQKK
nr:hypothetical protein [Candidatus Purcelliella pentastirinorum]